MERRTFLLSTATAVAGSMFLPAMSLRALINVHREICERTFSIAADRNLGRLPIGDLVVEIGKLFKGAPYEAHTLETPEEERLVINLEVFDCVTLVENTLALARCIKNDTTTFEAYAQELQQMRYRGGEIAGYPSRLHYFSDWIYDNVRKGIVSDVTQDVGGAEPFKKTINFMSTHRDRYRQLANDEYFDAIKRQEEVIDGREYSFIPKGNFHMYEDGLRDGDILAFTTNIRGLDIQHTALAINVDGNFHALHAPDAGRSVEITGPDLMQYMTMNKRMTGLMVARPNEI